MARPKKPEKARKIKKIVARLFAEKGYHATSMREVGRYAGLNQSSLYNYFKSKEDILFHIMNDAMDEALATIEEICEMSLAPEDKLNRVLDFYARYYAGDKENLTLLVNEMQALEDAHHRILLEKQRRYVALIRSILEALCDSKRMKNIHPTIATFAFFGMVHYTIKWYSKDGAISPEALAECFVEIFTKGILAS